MTESKHTPQSWVYGSKGVDEYYGEFTRSDLLTVGD